MIKAKEQMAFSLFSEILTTHEIQSLKKTDLVFLHVYKTGGTSFWMSLAEAAAQVGNGHFAVRDAFSDVMTGYRGVSTEGEALAEIKRDILKHPAKKLLIHYHTTEGNILRIFPNAAIIVMHRTPRDRLYSAFRHWRGEFRDEEPRKFFESAYCRGVNHFLSGPLGYALDPFKRPPQWFVKIVNQMVVFVSLAEYLSQSKRFSRIVSAMGVRKVGVLHYEGTITNQAYGTELFGLLNGESHEFETLWSRFLHAEAEWHSALGLKN